MPRYKALLLKQRDIMIALTERLRERDERILALQDDLDAGDAASKCGVWGFAGCFLGDLPPCEPKSAGSTQPGCQRSPCSQLHCRLPLCCVKDLSAAQMPPAAQMKAVSTLKLLYNDMLSQAQAAAGRAGPAVGGADSAAQGGGGGAGRGARAAVGAAAVGARPLGRRAPGICSRAGFSAGVGTPAPMLMSRKFSHIP